MPFELHPKLARDTLNVTDLPLCSVRLLNDSRFPWLVLIPRRANLRELHHLSESDQRRLLAESGRMAALLERLYQPDKLNLGALGNLVPQFHWHIVVRRQADPCWPGPVWGCGTAIRYPTREAQRHILELRSALTSS